MTLNVKHFSQLTTDELYRIIQARIEVFVVEQQCPYRELDNKDLDAIHVWYEENGKILAYIRLLDKGVSYPDCASIGRVITLRRSAGLGEKIMLDGIRLAKEHYGADRLRIGAQLYAKGFYEKVGFVQSSDEYDEDGITHIEMTRG